LSLLSLLPILAEGPQSLGEQEDDFETWFTHAQLYGERW